jgi:membrane protease subunit (stomatin/prohibitin family)
MGLISLVKDTVGAGLNALGGTVDSVIWKEYFESGDMSNGVLMKRGEKIITGKGKNTKADDNLISSGSGIDVQEGQCMILVENGKIVEFCAEPGRYTYDASIQPSLYAGENKGLKALGKEILSQWSAGGQRFSTQRVYFINMGELIYTPIKWGCGDIAFHHTQVYKATNSLLELDMTLRANGQCTVQVTDPVKFFKVIGAQKTGADNNALIRVTDDGIMSNLKSGVIDHISSAISTLGYEQQVPYTAIKAKTKDIKNYLNAEIEKEWAGSRGFNIANITINGSPIPSDENKRQLEEMQASFNISQNVTAANYDIQKTMARGFESAGKNPGGPTNIMAMGMGMGMSPMGGANFGNLTQQNPTPTPTPAPRVSANAWVCTCGATNDGKFCSSCGAKKVVADSWVCKCGKTATGKFCSECGAKKAPTGFKCDKCGWVPEDGFMVKFCPECGDIFNDADIVE